VSDKAALQNGAKLFVNYCLNCHGASYMRYNRLTELGLDRAAGQGQPDVHRRQDRRA
jgi:cytochrome c1